MRIILLLTIMTTLMLNYIVDSTEIFKKTMEYMDVVVDPTEIFQKTMGYIDLDLFFIYSLQSESY